MIEITALEGPLDDSALQWVAELYGRVDPRYATRPQLEHLFRNAPAAPALHAFAFDADRPVGHCAVVPMTAREDARSFLCGKVEALVVDEPYRGRRASSPPVALRLRDALYSLADAQGIELLHAYVRPEVGHVLDLTPLRVGRPSHVALLRPPATGRARLPAAALSSVQRAALALAGAAGRPERVAVREPSSAHVELVRAPPPPRGCWTVLAEDTWDWLRASPYVQVLELDDALALVELPGTAGAALRLVSWAPKRPGRAAALRVLVAAARLGRAKGAGSLRFQPWGAPESHSTLAHACRALGFVRRDDFTTLYVRARDPRLVRENAVVSTPLLALGF